MTNEQIKHMVDRFLNWKLPKTFNPDNGISYSRPNYHPNVDATNLFDAVQADAMVRHMLEGLPPVAETPSQPDREAVARAICKSKTCEGFLCCQWPGSMGRTNCPVKSGGYDDAADAVLSLLSVQVDGEQKETHATKPSPSSTSATATETAVLDLLGPMLDAWDSLSNDEHVRISKIAPDFTLHLVAVRAAADSTNQPLPQTHAKTDAGLVSGARP